MSNIQPYRSGSQMSQRDARTLDHSLSGLQAHTTAELAVIDAAGQKFEAIMEINTGLTKQVW